MANCVACGKALSVIERVGEDICRSCARERKLDHQREQDDWKRLHAELTSSAVDASAVDRAVTLRLEGRLPSDERQDHAGEAVRAFAKGRIRDGMLSVSDEQLISNFAERMGFSGTWERWVGSGSALSATLVIASVNAGRLPMEPASNYVMDAAAGESLHYRVPNAVLLSMRRNYVRTYQGVSLPIGRTRVRYHLGTSSGRIVETEFEPADTGSLLITSRRVLFMGRQNTKNIYYNQLVDIRVFTDGLEFPLSNRVKPVALRLGSPVAEVAGAIAQVAARRALGTWSAPPLADEIGDVPEALPASVSSGLADLDALGQEIDSRLTNEEESNE